MKKTGSKFWQSAQWVTRLALLPPTTIFGLIAGRYLSNPIEHAAAVGITFQSAMGVTVARVGFGGFPLGCCLFSLICLISARRLLTGLGFFVLMDSVVLVVRTLGMFADASVQQNMRLIYAEIVLLVITSAGMLLELRRRTILRRLGREFEASVPISS